jgi:hypothetical protein
MVGRWEGLSTAPRASLHPSPTFTFSVMDTSKPAGEGPMVRQPDTGKYRRTRLFVFRLGYSRKSIPLIALQLHPPV